MQLASGNSVRAVLFNIFLVPPTSSFLGVDVYHLLWFVNDSMAVATACVGPCPKSDLCRHLLFTRAGKQWLTKPLKHLAHHSFKRGPNGGFFSCLDEHGSPVVLSEQIEIMWKRMINQGMRLRQKSSPKDQIGWSPVGP